MVFNICEGREGQFGHKSTEGKSISSSLPRLLQQLRPGQNMSDGMSATGKSKPRVTYAN